VTVTARSGEKRPKDSAAHALMMRSVPYFAQKMAHGAIAKLFRKSERQIARWSAHPDVLAALGEVSAAVTEATKVQAVELAELAWATLREVMRDGQDERTRVTAAQLVLDRTGHGPTSKQEVSGPAGTPLHITIDDVAKLEELVRTKGKR
jgi:hypothetical protein